MILGIIPNWHPKYCSENFYKSHNGELEDFDPDFEERT